MMTSQRTPLELYMRPILVAAVLLFAPVSALAQGGPSAASDTSAAQSGAIPQAGDARPGSDILNMDIEQLARTPVVVPSMDIPVTSVTKEASTVGRSAAAVFVITNEMIRRSGVTCVPEALRMAPGLEVAHINANTWAITARGFNGIYANKLLVLIDGRTVYSPVFSGVYWDAQDVLLEDVDRIEVVRGPGGTLWGANAVNGVINIITKNAKDTQGAYVTAGGGTQERMNDAVRYGGQIGEDCQYRVYGKHFERGPGFDPTGPPEDSWRQGQFGFRTDWDVDSSKTNCLTVQGDCYTGEAGTSKLRTQAVPPFSSLETGYIDNAGQNILARWRHTYDEDSDWTLQTYFDNYTRGNLILSERVRTFDVDFQYRFPVGDRHQITCGAGYRQISDQCPSEAPFSSSILPPDQTVSFSNQFVQDEITLVQDQLDMIVGCKLEQNPYTGLEYEPTARLLWTPDRRHTCWGAVSRAVRTPSQDDRGIFSTAPPVLTPTPFFARLLGNPAFQSETVIAYEVGYRTQATERFSYDIATFYNVYDGLASAVAGRPFVETVPPPRHFILPLTLSNKLMADSYGVELATHWSISDHWRLSTQYTFLRVFIHSTPPAGGDSPKHQVYMRSSWDLREDLDFDLTLRYVDCLTTIDVPSYVTMDLRLAWRPYKHVELAVVGQNLLQEYHQEYIATSNNPGFEATDVPRGVYGTLSWRY